MPLVGLPVFTSREVLTAAKLNSAMDTITAKFNAGLTTGDVAWPLAAGGNIDMSFFKFLNLPRFWNVYNIADRNTGAGVTVQNVYDTVAAEGGGVIYVPQNTTIQADFIDVDSNTSTVGANWTSVLQVSATPSRQFWIQDKVAGKQNIWFVNLKLDGGPSITAGAASFRFSTRIKFINCWFDDWNDSYLRLTNNGTPGNACTDVELDHCLFDNGAAATPKVHLELVDVDGLDVSFTRFGLTTGGCIKAAVADIGQKVKKVRIVHSKFKVSATNTAAAILITKTGPTALSLDQADLTIENNNFDGQAVNSFACIDLRYWEHFSVKHNKIHDCTSTLPAIRAQNCDNFQINDNGIWNYTNGEGIVVGSQGYSTTPIGARTDQPCNYFQVMNNRLRNIGTAGIVFTGGSKFWDVSNNRVIECSQLTTVTYAGLEFWFTTNATDTGGSAINGNSGLDGTVAAPNQLAGLETWSTGGTGGAANSNVGGAGASNLRVVNNDLPGMTTGGAGTDFAATSVPNRHVFANNAGV